ncbi:hypothetical protein EZ449_06485 [Pedobacter frigidisoli]|uniref:Glycoside hydrolase family 19 catalytic domain-containing protein n=1 Tax=Pedobacter frigidisoli TaxID=2530455 RepID=A0A4R0P6M9_9SPHI|nr:chitinase [Pedobacter frigidisoli]TCD11138.1 hypothetical protein EZ449_06485 [Pedobacter frigidisoli]
MKVLYKSFAILLLFFSFGLVKVQAIQKEIISEKDFNNCFPLRNKFYTYTAFTKAFSEISFIKIKVEKRGDWIYKITRTDKRANKTTLVRQDKDWNEVWAKAKPYSSIDVDYGDFCTNKESNINKKELAAFFAHIAHETRNGINNQFNDGLMLINEIDTNAAYFTENIIYPAVAGKKYYGRGPLQLSYNGNYGFTSDCIFGDKNTLLNNPSLISINPVLAFETAIFFWMTPQGSKPSAHQVMTGNWNQTSADKQNGYTSGFGLTINIINGKLECGKGEDTAPMLDRIGFYQYFLKKFKIIDDNCACSCAQMTPFSG